MNLKKLTERYILHASEDQNCNEMNLVRAPVVYLKRNGCAMMDPVLEIKKCAIKQRLVLVIFDYQNFLFIKI